MARVCSRCGESDQAEFHKQRGAKDWLRKHCKTCRAEEHQAYVASNPEKVAARHHKYWLANREKISAYTAEWHAEHRGERIVDAREAYQRRKHETPEAWMLSRIKHSAKSRGIAFDLTPEDISIPPTCPVLGTPMGFRGDGLKGPCQTSPSLDRKIPALGYVRGNVVVMSHRANTLKNNATLDEIRLLLAYMEREAAKPQS